MGDFLPEHDDLIETAAGPVLLIFFGWLSVASASLIREKILVGRQKDIRLSFRCMTIKKTESSARSFQK